MLNKQLSIVSMSTVLQPFINDLNSATELLQVDTRGLIAEVSDTGVALRCLRTIHELIEPFLLKSWLRQPGNPTHQSTLQHSKDACLRYVGPVGDSESCSLHAYGRS